MSEAEKKLHEETERDDKGAASLPFASFREFIKFAEYAPDAALVSFAEPVVDTAGVTLIQKSAHLRPGIMKSLWNFFNQGNLNEKISISWGKELRTVIGEKICRSLCKCLEPGRFHLAQTLADVSSINIRAMLGSVVQRRDILQLLVKLDQDEDPLLPHLGEVALVAGGFAEQYFKATNESREARDGVRLAITAGLLHDIGLADDDDFLSKDIEKAVESQHAAKGAMLVRKSIPEIDPYVTEIIENHHRMGNPYDPASPPTLTAPSVAAEAVALSEFVFLILRSQYKIDEKMSSAELLFYDLGCAFGRGKFHPRFGKIAAQLWESLYVTLHYGLEIGLLENRCPHKPSAIAYPSPRCTQIMCHLDVRSCQYYDAQFPLEILQAMRFPGNPGTLIKPGKYSKCKLAQFLPKDTGQQKMASKWMDRGETSSRGVKPGAP